MGILFIGEQQEFRYSIIDKLFCLQTLTVMEKNFGSLQENRDFAEFVVLSVDNVFKLGCFSCFLFYVC